MSSSRVKINVVFSGIFSFLRPRFPFFHTNFTYPLFFHKFFIVLLFDDVSEAETNGGCV